MICGLCLGDLYRGKTEIYTISALIDFRTSTTLKMLILLGVYAAGVQRYNKTTPFCFYFSQRSNSDRTELRQEPSLIKSMLKESHVKKKMPFRTPAVLSEFKHGAMADGPGCRCLDTEMKENSWWTEFPPVAGRSLVNVCEPGYMMSL